MQSILITGCNRGIGLGLVKAFLQKEGNKTIIATCRDLSKATELQELTKKNPQLKILTLDLKDFTTYEKFAAQVGDLTKGKGLNLLINNAGISTKYTRIDLVKLDQLMDNLAVNTVAPIMLTKALLPLLRQAAKTDESEPVGIRRAAVINITSILGSIQSNTDGGFYPYRCSKAALNAATKSLSVDLKREGILVTCIHPGWVKTDMGGKNAPLEVTTATGTLVSTLEGLSETHSGQFLQYDGKPLPW